MVTYAITSGKGGVGKTNLAANLAIALATKGKRVVVFDVDIGLANLDVVLGVRAEHTLQEVLRGAKRLNEVIQVAPGGIRFVAGGSGIESIMSISGPTAANFLAELNELERSIDVLIFDTAAGIDENVMTFLQAADEVLLVATPDPASLTDGYATAKAILGRKRDAVVRVIMNMVDDESQGRAVFAKLTSIAQQFLGVPLRYAGCVRLDVKASSFIRARKPFLLGDSHIPASQDVLRVASSLVGEPSSRAVVGVGLGERLKSLFSGFVRAA